MTSTFKRFGSIFAALAMVLTMAGNIPLAARADENSGSEVITIEAEAFAFDGNAEYPNDGAAISGYQNMTASYKLSSDFASGKYLMLVKYVSGASSTLEVRVGDSVYTADWTMNSDWSWEQWSYLEVGPMELNAGDTLKVHATGESPYIQIDNFTLVPAAAATVIEAENMSHVYVGGGDFVNQKDDADYVYEMENYYTGNISENAAADLQPGETIEVELAGIAAGTYSLAISSCGNRESFEILVNGKSVGNITRAGTDFGMDQMTYDILPGVLELKAGDKVTVAAPASGYGWVDCMTLVNVNDSEQGESWGHTYVSNLDDLKYSCTMPSDFAAGSYLVTIPYVSGCKSTLELTVGEQTYSIDWNINSGWSWDRWSVMSAGVIELKPGDTISLHAVGENAYIQIDSIKLTALHAFTTRASSAVASAATCSSPAAYYVQCDACGKVHETMMVSVGEALGHDYTAVVTTPATCTEEGVMTYTCKHDASHTYTEPIQAAGHVDENGDLKCDRCDENLCQEHTDSTEDNDHLCDKCGAVCGEHSYTKTTVAADCENGGYDLHTCNCGDSYKDNVTDPLNHKWNEGVVTKEATCTEDGQITYTCQNDPAHTYTEAMKAEGHQWDDGVVIKAPTSAADGAVTYTCGVCGKTKTETIAKLPDGATETRDGAYVYQAEHYYSGNICQDCAADLQPGESLQISLNSNPDFKAGKYILTISSCGGRTSYEVLVNGESVGTISRLANEYGWDMMTGDSLSTVLDLDEDDVVTITAPDSGYGWVDCLELTAYQEGSKDPDTEEEKPTYNVDYDYIIYQCEDYYTGNISENVAADLQPGESIHIPLGSKEEFQAGYYKLTVYSCGNRESFEILVNGKSVGTVTRTGTGFGQDQMTYDKLSVVLELSPEDTVTLVAPDGEVWGWVDFIVLDVVREAADTADSTELLVPVFVGAGVAALAVVLLKKRRFFL